MNTQHDPNQLLDGYREATRHSPALVADSLEQTLGRIGAGEHVPMPPPVPSGSTALGLKLVVGLGLLGALALGGTWVARQGLPNDDARGEAAQLSAVPETPPPPGPPKVSLPAVAPEPRPATDIEPIAARVETPVARKRPSKPKQAKAPQASGLDEEIELMAAARRALASDDPDEALEVLEKHRDRFPDGQLRADRNQSMVTALCQLGRTEDARRLAKRAKAKLGACEASP